MEHNIDKRIVRPCLDIPDPEMIKHLLGNIEVLVPIVLEHMSSDEVIIMRHK